MRRIGVFGGTFDPVHVGHLVAASEVRHALALDVVLLVVANDPWQKAGRRIAPARDRLAVVEAAVADVEGIEASGIEIERGGSSYTADTLADLHRHDPAASLHLVVGADVVHLLHTWERADDVRRSSRLAIVDRGEEHATVPDGWEADIVPIPSIRLSSTDVRERLRSGRPVDFLVPAAAVRELRARGLYA